MIQGHTEFFVKNPHQNNWEPCLGNSTGKDPFGRWLKKPTGFEKVKKDGTLGDSWDGEKHPL